MKTWVRFFGDDGVVLGDVETRGRKAIFLCPYKQIKVRVTGIAAKADGGDWVQLIAKALPVTLLEGERAYSGDVLEIDLNRVRLPGEGARVGRLSVLEARSTVKIGKEKWKGARVS